MPQKNMDDEVISKNVSQDTHLTLIADRAFILAYFPKQ